MWYITYRKVNEIKNTESSNGYESLNFPIKKIISDKNKYLCGLEQRSARLPHKQEVEGSNPPSAICRFLFILYYFFC